MDWGSWFSLDTVIDLLTYLSVTVIGIGIIIIVFDSVFYIIDSKKERKDMGNSYTGLFKIGITLVLSGAVLIYGLSETNLI